MRMIYNNKSINLVEHKTFFKRFLGFMGKKNINHAILFDNCSSIHTFFMKENIDVIFLDGDNKIVSIYINVGKNRIIFSKEKARKTIELPVNYFKFKLLEKIDIVDD